MATRLTPYSLYIPEDMLVRIKKLAKDRQASAMIRDAITMALDGSDAFEGGYKKAVKDCISIIKKDELLNRIGAAKQLEKQLQTIIKEKRNGYSKKS